MADFIPIANTTTAQTLSDGEQAYIGKGIQVGRISAGNNTSIIIDGTAASNFDTIFVGATSYTEIGATGSVYGGASALATTGDGGVVYNAGHMFGQYYGIVHFTGLFSEIYNSGTITAGIKGGVNNNAAIDNRRASGDTYLENTGLIETKLKGSFAYKSTGAVNDTILNNGAMIGKVSLGDGADTFDSRGGSVKGAIDGGLGADKLYAGAGNNTLSGGAGADSLGGGAGADKLDGGADTDSATYFYASAAVTVSLTTPSTNTGDAAGDTYVSIENISGSAFNDTLSGNAGANTIWGNGGNDVIRGFAGNDTLTGASGKDTFVFHTALNATTNVDKITDFSAVNDTIQLENAVFTALTATGALSAAAFRANATGLAADSTDRIVYETDTGKLFYDRDGSGVSYDGVLFATLVNKPAITNLDFIVI